MELFYARRPGLVPPSCGGKRDLRRRTEVCRMCRREGNLFVVWPIARSPLYFLLQDLTSTRYRQALTSLRQRDAKRLATSPSPCEGIEDSAEGGEFFGLFSLVHKSALFQSHIIQAQEEGRQILTASPSRSSSPVPEKWWSLSIAQFPVVRHWGRDFTRRMIIFPSAPEVRHWGRD